MPARVCNSGEGEGEGEGSGDTRYTADINGDNVVNLSELLRVIQFYNSDDLGCEPGTGDGYAPYDADHDGPAHTSDYNPQNRVISLGELLRVIQFYNAAGYHLCAEGEDGFCPGSGWDHGGPACMKPRGVPSPHASKCRGALARTGLLWRPFITKCSSDPVVFFHFVNL